MTDETNNHHGDQESPDERPDSTADALLALAGERRVLLHNAAGAAHGRRPSGPDTNQRGAHHGAR